MIAPGNHWDFDPLRGAPPPGEGLGAAGGRLSSPCQGSWRRGVVVLSLRHGICRAISLCTREALAGCFQHILDKNAISSLRIIYQNVGHGADELAVLDDGTSGHADVKCGTKEFCVFL